MHPAKLVFYSWLNKKKGLSSCGQKSPVCLKISQRSPFVLLVTCSFVLFASLKVFPFFFPLNSSHRFVSKLKLPFTLQLPVSEGSPPPPREKHYLTRHYSILHLASHQPEDRRDAFSVATPEFPRQNPQATPLWNRRRVVMFEFPAIKEKMHVHSFAHGPPGPITVRKAWSQFTRRFTTVHGRNQKTLSAETIYDYFSLWGFSRVERLKVLSHGGPTQTQFSTLQAPTLSLCSWNRKLSEDPPVFSNYFPTMNEFAFKLYLWPI